MIRSYENDTLDLKMFMLIRDANEQDFILKLT